ncbi:hypothetical protein FH972_023274 [Carpinus fangiana]|uniref:Uncharacterized protein n=1 Tax=Carpinus fangiana TaxID=176857 RepID=A0A5N6KUR1_9ROSI|nr:hypothetical protein FH972_023274 [Carpinus fangiana]
MARTLHLDLLPPTANREVIFPCTCRACAVAFHAGPEDLLRHHAARRVGSASHPTSSDADRATSMPSADALLTCKVYQGTRIRSSQMHA